MSADEKRAIATKMPFPAQKSNEAKEKLIIRKKL